MALFRSVRERRLWLAVAGVVGLLLAALYPSQFVLDALRERSILRFTIAGLFVVAAGATALALARRRVPLLTWLVAALAATIYAALALAMEVPQERLHLVEYGAFALLVRAAVACSIAVREPGGRVRTADVWALMIVTLVGGLDEAVQGLLPNRVLDLRDVAFNALAAALALGTAAAVRATMVAAARRARAVPTA